MSNLATVENFRSLKSFLESPSVVSQIGKLVRHGLNANRLIRQALTLASDSPKLLNCSQVSIITGIVKAAELGLELSGPLGHAYLVPRYSKEAGGQVATFQVGWKGLVLLAMRTGRIASFPVRTVYAKDKFNITYGDKQSITHEPCYQGERGDSIGYYAIAIYRGGGSDFEYMSKEEVVEHKAKYGGNGPGWSSAFDAMGQKTVVRRLCRRLSLCPEAQAQVMEEEYIEHGVPLRPQLENVDAVDEIILLGNAQEQETYEEKPE